MTKIARIVGGVVENIVEVDSDPFLRPSDLLGMPEASDSVQIGQVFVKGTFFPEGSDPATESKRYNMELTFRQMLYALVSEGVITSTEGLAWSRGDTLPAIVETFIATLPLAEQDFARYTLFRMSVVLRRDYLVSALAAQASLTDEQVDLIFEGYANV